MNQQGASENLDEELRRRLLPYFVKNNRTRYKEIREAIANNDIMRARILVHTLRCNAAQFGKTVLQQIAGEIEQRLKDGQDLVTEEQWKILETELIAVLNEFAPLLEETSQGGNQAELSQECLDKKSSRELLGELEPLLEMGSSESRALTGKLRLIPESGGLKTRLIQQIEDMDFEQAIVTLAELKSGLE